MILNKSPGKDINHDDIKNKIPLVAKKNKKHFSKINIAGITFGGKKTINNISCAERYDRYQNQPTAWIDLDCSEKEKKSL